MLIRDGVASDVPAVWAIVQTVIGQHADFNESARQTALGANGPDRLAQRIARRPSGLLVAEVDGVVQGFATMNMDCGTLYIPWICTRPDARHRRLGPALYQAAIAEARRRGCHKVWGVSLPGARSINRYLERIGGRVVGTMTKHWHGQDYVYWELVF